VRTTSACCAWIRLVRHSKKSGKRSSDTKRRWGATASSGSVCFRLFRSAGFSRIELSVLPEVQWFGSEAFFPRIQNLIGNIDSARRGMIDAGLCGTEQIERAVAELQDCLRSPDASSYFMWNRAMAVR
jgi:hypothetical protein